MIEIIVTIYVHLEWIYIIDYAVYNYIHPHVCTIKWSAPMRGREQGTRQLHIELSSIQDLLGTINKIRYI